MQTPVRREGKNNKSHLLPIAFSASKKLSPRNAESVMSDKLVNRMTGAWLLAISIDKALCVCVHAHANGCVCFPVSQACMPKEREGIEEGNDLL